jgi:hypothetical protein
MRKKIRQEKKTIQIYNISNLTFLKLSPRGFTFKTKIKFQTFINHAVFFTTRQNQIYLFCHTYVNKSDYCNATKIYKIYHLNFFLTFTNFPFRYMCSWIRVSTCSIVQFQTIISEKDLFVVCSIVKKLTNCGQQCFSIMYSIKSLSTH